MIISINTNQEIVINIENNHDQRISLDEYCRTLSAIDILKAKIQDEMIHNTQRTLTESDNNRMIIKQRNGDNNKIVNIKLHNNND